MTRAERRAANRAAWAAGRTTPDLEETIRAADAERRELAARYPPFACRACATLETPGLLVDRGLAARLTRHRLCWRCFFWDLWSREPRGEIDGDGVAWTLGPEVGEGGVLVGERRHAWAVRVGAVPAHQVGDGDRPSGTSTIRPASRFIRRPTVRIDPTLVDLRLEEGATYQEIAAELGVSVGGLAAWRRRRAAEWRDQRGR